MPCPDTLIHADCLEAMKHIADGSVSAIIADLPYGTTACTWDTVIPFEPLWEAYKRVIKPGGAIVLTASQPFASALVMSNPKMFKYEWSWDKKSSTCFVHAKHRPLGSHEDILVFGIGRTTYNPQMTQGKPYYRGLVNNDSLESCPTKKGKSVIGQSKDGLRYPKTTIQFANSDRRKQLHPTQKPVALLEYLVRTYTNPGDLVLDNCMGSATLPVACLNTGRHFIGIEKDDAYFDTAVTRVRTRELELASTLDL